MYTPIYIYVHSCASVEWESATALSRGGRNCARARARARTCVYVCAVRLYACNRWACYALPLRRYALRNVSLRRECDPCRRVELFARGASRWRIPSRIAHGHLRHADDRGYEQRGIEAGRRATQERRRRRRWRQRRRGGIYVESDQFQFSSLPLTTPALHALARPRRRQQWRPRRDFPFPVALAEYHASSNSRTSSLPSRFLFLLLSHSPSLPPPLRSPLPFSPSLPLSLSLALTLLDLASLHGSRRATPMSLHRSLSRSSTRTASAPFSYIYAHSTASGVSPYVYVSRPFWLTRVGGIPLSFVPSLNPGWAALRGDDVFRRWGRQATATAVFREHDAQAERRRRRRRRYGARHSDDMPPARRQRRLASRRSSPHPAPLRRTPSEPTRVRADEGNADRERVSNRQIRQWTIRRDWTSWTWEHYDTHIISLILKATLITLLLALLVITIITDQTCDMPVMRGKYSQTLDFASQSIFFIFFVYSAWNILCDWYIYKMNPRFVRD